ncbi:hypothetical protein [Oceanobacillus sojae]
MESAQYLIGGIASSFYEAVCFWGIWETDGLIYDKLLFTSS